MAAHALARAGCQGRLQSCRANKAVVVVCKAQPASLVPPPQIKKPSVLRNLSKLVEVQDCVRRYEELAGRSAMVGFAVALASELLTDKGVFFSMTGDMATAYGAGAVAVLTLAGTLAVVRNNQLQEDGLQLLESVYASLTAVRRSASSVSQAQVDRAVDRIMDEMDGFRLLGTLLEDDWV